MLNLLFYKNRKALHLFTFSLMPLNQYLWRFYKYNHIFSWFYTRNNFCTWPQPKGRIVPGVLLIATILYLFKNNTTYGSKKQVFFGQKVRDTHTPTPTFCLLLGSLFLLLVCLFQPQSEAVCLVLLSLVLSCLAVFSWRLLFSEEEIEGEWTWVGGEGKWGRAGRTEGGENAIEMYYA